MIDINFNLLFIYLFYIFQINLFLFYDLLEYLVNYLYYFLFDCNFQVDPFAHFSIFITNYLFFSIKYSIFILSLIYYKSIILFIKLVYK
jgi:hypothetical protein